MKIWLRRFGFVIVIVAILEIMAWIILIFVPFPIPSSPDNPTLPINTVDGKKCSTYDNKTYCIKEKK